MYIPEVFAENDLSTLHAFMRHHALATLVTQRQGAPSVSHVPVLLDSSVGTHGVLLGHLARNNAQWHELAEGAEVLAIFHGPHAYVSPAWYEPNPMAVPTWNFMAAHAYGKARILPDDELVSALHRQVDENEKEYASPWGLELSSAMRERMLGAIVGFEIKLNNVEGKFKLSQNRTEQDQRNVIAHLSQSEGGKEVAYWMSKELERK